MDSWYEYQINMFNHLDCENDICIDMYESLYVIRSISYGQKYITYKF